MYSRIRTDPSLVSKSRPSKISMNMLNKYHQYVQDIITLQIALKERGPLVAFSHLCSLFLSFLLVILKSSQASVTNYFMMVLTTRKMRNWRLSSNSVVFTGRTIEMPIFDTASWVPCWTAGEFWECCFKWESERLRPSCRRNIRRRHRLLSFRWVILVVQMT